jgi:hypothetical protein
MLPTGSREQLDVLMGERLRMLEPDDAEDPDGAMAVERARMAQKHLAAWSGDISAAELASRLERDAVNGILSAGPLQTDAAVRMAEVVRDRWGELREWFPRPVDFRIRTPLVPVYDERRDRFGFWRVRLPDPDVTRLPVNEIPVRPFLLTLLLESRSELPDWRLREVRYETFREGVGAEGRHLKLPGKKKLWACADASWVTGEEATVATRICFENEEPGDASCLAPGSASVPWAPFRDLEICKALSPSRDEGPAPRSP